MRVTRKYTYLVENVGCTPRFDSKSSPLLPKYDKTPVADVSPLALLLTLPGPPMAGACTVCIADSDAPPAPSPQAARPGAARDFALPASSGSPAGKDALWATHSLYFLILTARRMRVLWSRIGRQGGRIRIGNISDIGGEQCH